MQPPHLPPSKHEAVLRWREFDGQTECRFKNLGDFLRTFQYHVSTAYKVYIKNRSAKSDRKL